MLIPRCRARSEWTSPPLSRRSSRPTLAAATAGPMIWSPRALAPDGKSRGDQQVAASRARARARGISDATHPLATSSIKPATTGFELDRRSAWSRLTAEHDPEKWVPVFGNDHAPPICGLLARLRAGV